MTWLACDNCGRTDYTSENPFVEFRQPRPSNRQEMCCVLAGHARCYRVEVSSLPSIGETGGTATPEQWEAWIEGEGAKQGFLWLG